MRADAGKMRVFLSDVMSDQEKDAKGRRVPITFGKGNCTVFRKAMSTEDAPAAPLADVNRVLLACERPMGHELPNEGGVRVVFDDSIVQGTTSEKRQDVDEAAAGLMDRAEYRAKWYGESRE